MPHIKCWRRKVRSWTMTMLDRIGKKTLTRHLSRWLSAGGSSKTAAATPAGWQPGHVWHEHRRRKNNKHESIGFPSYRSLETLWLPRRCNLYWHCKCCCIPEVEWGGDSLVWDVFPWGISSAFFPAVRHSYTSQSFICVLKIKYRICGVWVCARQDIKQDDFSYSNMSPRCKISS